MIKYVYVAGPLTVGGTGTNLRNASWAADALMQRGFVPFVPHLSFYFDLLYPHSYEEWMDWCLAWVARCDAVLRLPGASDGAVREVEFARSRNLPVFGSGTQTFYGALDDLSAHVKKESLALLPGSFHRFEAIQEATTTCLICGRSFSAEALWPHPEEINLNNVPGCEGKPT